MSRSGTGREAKGSTGESARRRSLADQTAGETPQSCRHPHSTSLLPNALVASGGYRQKLTSNGAACSKNNV